MTDAERDPAEAGDAPDPIAARQRAIEAQVAALEAEAEQLTRLAGFRDDLAKQGIPFEVIGMRAGEVQLVLTVGGDARVAVAGSGATVPRGNLDAPKWTEAEEDLCWDVAQEGHSVAEIAHRLERSPQGVAAKLRGLKRKRGAAKGAPAAAAEPEVAPTFAPVREMPRPAPVERAVPDRPSGWTAARDLALVEGILRGRKLADLAPELELGTDDLKARWKQLMPVSSIEAQRKLVTRLRAEVAAEDAA